MSKYYVYEVVAKSGIYARNYACTYQKAYEYGLEELDACAPTEEDLDSIQLRIGKVMKIGLCAGRHDLPVDDFLFDEIIDPMAFAEMEKKIDEKIPEGTFEVQCYITGLTSAALALVKVCERRCIRLVAYHYNKEKEWYEPQTVLCGKMGGVLLD